MRVGDNLDLLQTSLGGSPGDDRINGLGVEGRDTLNGGPGVDTASFAGSATPVNASLVSGFARRVRTNPLEGVALVGIENLTGSAIANALVGGSGADKMFGLAGNDTLNARDGVNRNDSLDGGGVPTGASRTLRKPPSGAASRAHKRSELD